MNILLHVQNILSVLKGLLVKKAMPFVYVALGDSTVAGIGASAPNKTVPAIIHKSLLQTHKNAKVYNLGISGSKTKDVIKKQLDKAIALEPNLITLSIGGNDIMYGKMLYAFKRDLLFLLKELRAKTKAQILINNIPDFSGAVVIPQPIRFIHNLRATRFNEAIQEICKTLNIIHVDIYSQSKLFSKYNEFISSDRLHPSDTGYALWANTILFHLNSRPIKTPTITF